MGGCELEASRRPKLLFDTMRRLTNMQYIAFHAAVIVEGSKAYQAALLCNIFNMNTYIYQTFRRGSY
ncbi:hypothetical protein FRX31_027215 [Thalictrum thalictroides]|uniref:Uncharacterized protein n=1 Tax=Thalictrum thalictroides TaxID=46969 RepID=A0A7J6VF04_THATH|nr:hypothetical protein FRX31_027215 [Thalictrum thalictroides]